MARAARRGPTAGAATATVPGKPTEIAQSSEPDVDPELERVRRRHAEQLALDEPPLDLAPLLRACSRRGTARAGRAVAASTPLGGEAVDQLGRLAALREADRPQAARRRARRAAATPRRARSRAGRAPRRAAAGSRSRSSRSARGARVAVDDRRRLAGQRSARARPGSRSSPRRAGTAARRRRSARAAAAAAARSRRASRRRRGRRAPRRRRRSGGSRARRPSGRGAGRTPTWSMSGLVRIDVRPLADLPAALGSACRRRRSPAAAPAAGARRARAPGPARAPSSGRGRARGVFGSRAIASSTGRLNASDLPRAVPVVTIDVLAAPRRLPGLGLVAVEGGDRRRDERRGDARVEVVRQRLERRLAGGSIAGVRDLLALEQVGPARRERSVQVRGERRARSGSCGCAPRPSPAARRPRRGSPSAARARRSATESRGSRRR